MIYQMIKPKENASFSFFHLVISTGSQCAVMSDNHNEMFHRA
jgi:hypothetical protein